MTVNSSERKVPTTESAKLSGERRWRSDSSSSGGRLFKKLGCGARALIARTRGQLRSRLRNAAPAAATGKGMIKLRPNRRTPKRSTNVTIDHRDRCAIAHFHVTCRVRDSGGAGHWPPAFPLPIGRCRSGYLRSSSPEPSHASSRRAAMSRPPMPKAMATATAAANSGMPKAISTMLEGTPSRGSANATAKTTMA